MYQIIGAEKLIKLSLYLLIASFLLCTIAWPLFYNIVDNLLNPPTAEMGIPSYIMNIVKKSWNDIVYPSTGKELLDDIKNSLVICSFFIFIGSSPVFPWLCRHMPLSRVFPDIDGKWSATTTSNWNIVGQRQSRESDKQPGSTTNSVGVEQTPPQASTKIEMTVVFRVRLLWISMQAESSDKYSYSKTTSISITRDPIHDDVSIHYTYENFTDSPKATDSSCHLGAARLFLTKDKEKHEMTGLYWTNRNWGKGLNTAGSITLTRIT